MTPEQFLTFADALPEPMLLLTSGGHVLAGNRAVESRLGLSLPAIRGQNLADVVADPVDEIAHYLRSCSRSRSLVLGALNVRGGSSDTVACRTEGTLLRPRTGTEDSILLLRMIPKESAAGQFIVLNQRIEELGQEIRRRQQSEVAARQQAEQLRVTLHSIGDGVIVCDAEGRVRLLNPVAHALTGWSPEEARGKPLAEVFRIINEQTREPVENPAMRALHERTIVGLANHTLLISRDGTERPIDDSAAPIRGDDGVVLGAVLVFRDVTQRQQAEELLRRSERQFRQLADAMPQIVWTARPDGNIDYMNRQWTEFSGMPATVGNAGWMEILHPDEAGPSVERWAASVQGGTPFEMPLRLRERGRNTYRWHLIRTVAVRDDEGQIVRWFGTSTDIHEQKRAEEASRYLADASAALAGVVDYESTLQKVARLAVPHFADWSAVDALGEDGALRRLAVAHQDPGKLQLVNTLMREYPPDPRAPTGALNVLRTGKPEIISEITDEMLVQGAQDATHLHMIRSLGLRSYICVPLVVAGQPIGALTFATAESGRSYSDADLALATELAHRASVALENTKLFQALRDAEQRKDEFLATLAHELRNPLAPIRNALQILKMPRVDPPTVTRSLNMMERQVEHLLRLVDDLLDVSRVMRGKIALRKERVELAAVVARAVETVQPIVDAHGHRLSIDLPPESLIIDADPVRLSQVVGNLLTNSAKYMEPGGRMWLTATRDGELAELRVRDTGIGISPQMLQRIFELFVQADHASTKAQGGLGIGLTLVKNLVEMHHGTVEARSEGLGLGSEFVVRLPTTPSVEEPERGADPEEDVRSAPAATGFRLLVVDDNPDAAESLAMLLGLQGHEVRVAFSGAAALEMTKAYTPELVFLDIGMPGMDGFELARRMRLQPGLEGVVLAALTGWGQAEDRRRTREAGFNHHLLKPPEPRAIESLLAGLRRASDPKAKRDAAPGNAGGAGPQE